jgi:hypothetical protein
VEAHQSSVEVLRRIGWEQLRHVAAIEALSRTGTGTTHRVQFFVKQGSGVIEESAVYRNFERQLGAEAANRIFPRTRCVPLSSDVSDAVLLIESIPGGDLEEQIGVLTHFVNGAPPDCRLVQEQQEKISATVACVSGHFDVLHACRETVHESAELRAFVQELYSALSENVLRAGLLIPPLPEPSSRWANGWASLAHRDCSVGNIVGAASRARLIDPRSIVPCGTTPATFASPAIDYAALLVSLGRKELELQRIVPEFQLEARTFLLQVFTSRRARGIASPAIIALCVAVVYSMYAACRCDYCLAPERRWLYDMMQESTTSHVNEFIHLAASSKESSS